MMQLARNMPAHLVGLDDVWPHAPHALQDTSNILKEMYKVYLARKFMNKLSFDEQEQVCVVNICREGYARGWGKKTRDSEGGKEDRAIKIQSNTYKTGEHTD